MATFEIRQKVVYAHPTTLGTKWEAAPWLYIVSGPMYRDDDARHADPYWRVALPDTGQVISFYERRLKPYVEPEPVQIPECYGAF